MRVIFLFSSLFHFYIFFFNFCLGIFLLLFIVVILYRLSWSCSKQNNSFQATFTRGLVKVYDFHVEETVYTRKFIDTLSDEIIYFSLLYNIEYIRYYRCWKDIKAKSNFSMGSILFQ